MGSFFIALLLAIAATLACGHESCPSSFSLALGSYTNHPWAPVSNGKGVYIVDYNNSALNIAMLLNTSITNQNPAYLLVRKPFLYISNENYPGNASVTRVFLSSDRKKTFTTFANTSGSFSVYVAQITNNIMVSANFLSSVDTFISVPQKRLRRADSFVVNPNLASEVVTNRTLGPMFGQPHPHIALPYGKGILICDAGSNIVWYFSVNKTNAKLKLLQSIKFQITDGPRHAAKHTTSDTVYVLNEISKSIVALKNNSTGLLSISQRVQVVDKSKAEVFMAAIRVTKDGRFLYVNARYPANQNNVLVGYRLNAQTGAIEQQIGRWDTFGEHARDFYIIERARYRNRCVSLVAVVHRDSDNLVLIERDFGSGMLRNRPAAILNVSTPTSVVPIW